MPIVTPPPPDWQNPDWAKRGRVHEWKNYVNDDVAAMWGTFTDAQKQALASNAAEIALCEAWD